MLIGISTLFSLLAMYVKEKNDQKDLNTSQFQEWLQDHNFKELSSQISDNQAWTEEIDSFLRKEFNFISESLEQINNNIKLLSLKLDIFPHKLIKTAEDFEVSQQAWEIMEHFYQSKSSKLFYIEAASGIHLRYNRSNKFAIPKDPQFVVDDLDILEKLGWIKKGINEGNVKRLYTPTRHGKQIYESRHSAS